MGLPCFERRGEQILFNYTAHFDDHDEVNGGESPVPTRASLESEKKHSTPYGKWFPTRCLEDESTVTRQSNLKFFAIDDVSLTSLSSIRSHAFWTVALAFYCPSEIVAHTGSMFQGASQSQNRSNEDHTRSSSLVVGKRKVVPTIKRAFHRLTRDEMSSNRSTEY